MGSLFSRSFINLNQSQGRIFGINERVDLINETIPVNQTVFHHHFMGPFRPLPPPYRTYNYAFVR